MPVWVAGYGPMALAAAGRVADGDHPPARRSRHHPLVPRLRPRRRRGSRPRSRRDRGHGRRAGVRQRRRRRRPRRVRWFPALVSNHVVDLINKYPKDELPEALWRYVENREGYDYLHHAEVGSDNAAFVSDQITDQFAIVGPAQPIASAWQQLREAGVTQFNIYLMNGEEEETDLDRLPGREIVGEFATASRVADLPCRIVR